MDSDIHGIGFSYDPWISIFLWWHGQNKAQFILGLISGVMRGSSFNSGMLFHFQSHKLLNFFNFSGGFGVTALRSALQSRIMHLLEIWSMHFL